MSDKIKPLPTRVSQHETPEQVLRRLLADEEWLTMDELVVVGFRSNLDEETTDAISTATVPTHLQPALLRQATRHAEARTYVDAQIAMMERKEKREGR